MPIKPFRIKSFKKNIQVASLKNISLSFGERKILDNINIDIYFPPIDTKISLKFY